MDIRHCQQFRDVSKIKVEERGKKAVILNATRETYLVTKVDGCVQVNAIAADWLITKKSVGDLIVELKGVDVDRGVEQVFATAQFWDVNNLRCGPIAGLVVGSEVPKFNTKIQRYKDRFAKAYKGPLHVVCRNEEYEFERVMSHDGPL